MLYLNVYLVGQSYGGPEEGGWYYAVGTPLASIPVPTSTEKGKEFYVNEEGIHIRECQTCKGTGKATLQDEENHSSYLGDCPDCEPIPADAEATWKMILEYRAMFGENELGRHESIQVSLQKEFAVAFPDQKPHYE